MCYYIVHMWYIFPVKIHKHLLLGLQTWYKFIKILHKYRMMFVHSVNLLNKTNQREQVLPTITKPAVLCNGSLSASYEAVTTSLKTSAFLRQDQRGLQHFKIVSSSSVVKHQYSLIQFLNLIIPRENVWSIRYNVLSKATNYKCI